MPVGEGVESSKNLGDKKAAQVEVIGTRKVIIEIQKKGERLKKKRSPRSAKRVSRPFRKKIGCLRSKGGGRKCSDGEW